MINNYYLLRELINSGLLPLFNRYELKLEWYRANALLGIVLFLFLGGYMSKKDFFYSISMLGFLTNFVGISDSLDADTLSKLGRATHKDIKELGIEYVKAVPFECVTEEDIFLGKIILVRDGRSTKRNERIAPYIRPEVLMAEKQESLKRGDDYARRIIFKENR